VNAGRLALGKTYVFRMAADGSSGGMDAEGPAIALTTRGEGIDTRGRKIAVAPRSAALSPDGKTLYLTGYSFCQYGKATRDIVTSGAWEHFHCVLKMNLDGDERPTLFAGNLEINKYGTDNKSFKVPVSVAVDKEGRVYVADYMNDRVQILSPDGSPLKTISTPNPSIVSIDGKTQDIYVFSSMVHNIFFVKDEERAKLKSGGKVTPQLTVFGPFDKPEKKSSCSLPEGFGGGGTGYLYSGFGFPLSAAVDGYTEPPTIWMANEWQRENVMSRGKINYHNITLFSYQNGKLEAKESFGKDVEKSVKRASPARYARPRLYANPKTGKVYVGEG